MTEIDNGLNVWQMTSNHNRMLDLQEDVSTPKDGPVELAYFGSSAFRITSPRGVSVMIDPWRNHPSRKWDWYFHDFPIVPVDIGTSTHAHFDHDALCHCAMFCAIICSSRRIKHFLRKSMLASTH